MDSGRRPAQPKVRIETAPGRANTTTGGALFKRFLKRVLVAGGCTSTAILLIWQSMGAVAHPVTIFLLGFLGFSTAFAIMYGGALVGDYQEKKRLADRYGCQIRFGLDTYQRRVVHIENPPQALAQVILTALGQLSPGATVQQLDARRFEARLPRKGNDLQCRVTVEVIETSADAVRVTVESKLTEPLGFTDIGRNIVNVEEFQLALQRLLEGESSSEKEPPPG